MKSYNAAGSGDADLRMMRDWHRSPGTSGIAMSPASCVKITSRIVPMFAAKPSSASNSLLCI